MPHKISLLIRALVDREAIEVIVTGCLTEQTVEVLLQQVRRAWTLGPTSPVRVDVTGARHIEAAALDALRQLSDATPADGAPHGRLHLEVPDQLPSCPLTGDHGTASRFAEPASPGTRRLPRHRTGSRILHRAPERLPR